MYKLLFLLLINQHLLALDITGTWSGFVKYQCKIPTIITIEESKNGYLGTYKLSNTRGCFVPEELVAKVSTFNLNHQGNGHLTGMTKDKIELDLTYNNQLLSGSWENFVSGPIELKRISKEIIPINDKISQNIFEKLIEPISHKE